MWTRIFAVILLLTGIGVPSVVGALQADYNPLAQYLSELGATGAPNAGVIKYAGFLPTGLALGGTLIGLYALLPKSSGTALGLAAIGLTSVSYIGAVFYPCDPGCPAEGSASQLIHNLLGLIGYVGPIAGLFMLHRAIRSKVAPLFSNATVLTAILMTVGFVALSVPDLGEIRGATQRAADFSLFLWVALLAFRLPKQTNA